MCVPAVLSHALIVEPIHLRDLARLVIATQDCDSVGVSQLEQHN
jgi:hypothetical protein